ncbi:MAG: 2-dehydro-3-deoxygalactonokinase [Planctomycetaceae bacterium]
MQPADHSARDDRPKPALVGLDWGTSSLRAHLFGSDGAIIETRTRPWGIRHLPEGGFGAAFTAVVGDWLTEVPTLPAVACGMVGSRQGWREVPYVDCPTDAGLLAAALVPCDTGHGVLHIVPGVMVKGDRATRPERLPDVMRGEETQICGALARAPDLAAASHVVLPGTHSKWCRVRDGRLTAFTTFMTGELFAVLRDHSLLGAPAAHATGETDAHEHRDPTAAAFLRGVKIARDAGAEGIAGRLFSTRTLYLAGDLAAEDVTDHLSGLLIGDEIRSALADQETSHASTPVLVGDPALCARYRAAFLEYGLEDPRILGDTAPAGLWTIATAMNLPATTKSPRSSSTKEGLPTHSRRRC